jgi:hypothetical protein
MASLLPSNILVNVQTYQKAELAWLMNTFVGIKIANKKFQNFQDKEAQLGDTVTFDLAPRSSTMNGLVIDIQASEQRFQSLVCSQATNSSYGFSNQQLLFNVEDYMERFGKSRILEIGTKIEADILRNYAGEVRVNNPQDPRFGQVLDPASGPYRFFGSSTNGTINPIDSSTQLASAIAGFMDFGYNPVNLCGILPSVNIPAIISTNANQFTPARANQEVYDWMLGEFADCDWYRSNLLPIHTSGNVGNASGTGNQLTLVSTNDPSGANITQLTFSGWSASDPNAMFVGDRGQFIFGVGGQPDLYFRQFIGHEVSSQPVQFRVTADASSDISGNVTVSIYPALSSTPGINQNLSTALQPGMIAAFMPNHKVGVIQSGNPLYLAMPRLPDQPPFPTVQTTDPESGASIRHYWGTQFGQNVMAYVYDQIWGSTVVAENSMALLFPVRA